MGATITTISTSGGTSRQLLVIPGRRYSAQLPAVFFPIKAFDEAGWSVSVAEWSEREIDDVTDETAFIEEVADALLATAEDAEHVMVLGKSLGSRAAAWAARNDVPAIWLTPLLNDDEVASAITDSAAETLLIGGTEDPAWNGPVARASGKEVLELKGADHSLECGDWQELMNNIEIATKTMIGFAMHHPTPAPSF